MVSLSIRGEYKWHGFAVCLWEECPDVDKRQVLGRATRYIRSFIRGGVCNVSVYSLTVYSERSYEMGAFECYSFVCPAVMGDVYKRQNQGMLSLTDIRRIIQSGKPIVWTMHDMWPFTGICHYAGDCDKYATQCLSLIHIFAKARYFIN